MRKGVKSLTSSVGIFHESNHLGLYQQINDESLFHENAQP